MKSTAFVVLLMLAIFSAAYGTYVSSETGEEVPGYQSQIPDDQFLPPTDEQSTRDVGSWTGNGPWGGNVRGLTTDPYDNLHVFAACGSSLTNQEGGVFASTDGGETWVPTTLPRKQYNAMAASLNEPGVFYAASRTGLYKSTDNGATWNIVGPTSAYYILGAGVKPNTQATIVIGKSGGVGLHCSTDGGNTFPATNITTGFMRQFTWSAADISRMYVVMGSSTSSILTSTDGMTWTGIGPTGNGWGMYVSPINNQFMLLAHDNGIYRTTNGGTNWDIVTSGAFKCVVEYAGNYYATANAGGMYESNDQGLTWHNYNVGVVQSTWQTGATSGAGALFGHWGGIFRASGYLQPVLTSHTGLNLGLVHGLAYYADTNELWGGLEGSGVYRSMDNGVTWEQKVNGLNNWMVYELQPTNHQYYLSGRMLAGTLDGAYTSTDGGNTWTLAHWSGNQISACEVHPTNPDIYWLGNSFGEVRYTFDGGVTFNTATGGAYGTFPRLKLGRGPTGDLRLFLFFQNGSINEIWYSDDLGVSFVHGTGVSATGYQPQIAIRPAVGTQPQIIYVSTGTGSTGNIFKSTDNGLTYTAANMTGFSWSVLCSPGAQVVSGTSSTILYSTDEAASSTALTQNLAANNNTWAIAWGNTTNKMFIATRARGIMQNEFTNTVYGFPTNLTAEPNHAQITLSWTPVSTTPAPVAYYVWRDGYPVGMVTAAQSSWTDTGLTDGQAYKYSVCAAYPGEIQTSAVQIITATPQPQGVILPATPQNVQLSISGTELFLDWNTVTTDMYGSPMSVSGYNVYWGEEPGFACNEESLCATTAGHSWVMNLVDIGVRIFFCVKAYVDPLVR
ncbi:MAG TPA: hypothetical protein PKI15_09145 [Candidatus Cloacimonadota bacterium]|nr:hypothetical protein [Candidatus Cloacimonadota bacterium]